MINRPLILVTNDDGVQSKGISSLIRVLCPLGDVVVVAPDGGRSGMSSAISSKLPIWLNLLKKEEGLTVYSCSGTPVDCVKLAVNEILDRKPDILVSGINHGSNSSICVLYSGTMGAALEGTIFGIPSVGVSLTDHSSDADFSDVAKYAAVITSKVLDEGLPQGVCLNVNVPDVKLVKGIKVCRQAKGLWVKEFMKSKDALDNDIYWLTGYFQNEEPESEDTDEWALSHGYVSVVPTQIDMTAYEAVKNLKNWEVQTISEPSFLN